MDRPGANRGHRHGGGPEPPRRDGRQSRPSSLTARRRPPVRPAHLARLGNRTTSNLVVARDAAAATGAEQASTSQSEDQLLAGDPMSDLLWRHHRSALGLERIAASVEREDLAEGWAEVITLIEAAIALREQSPASGGQPAVGTDEASIALAQFEQMAQVHMTAMRATSAEIQAEIELLESAKILADTARDLFILTAIIAGTGGYGASVAPTLLGMGKIIASCAVIGAAITSGVETGGALLADAVTLIVDGVETQLDDLATLQLDTWDALRRGLIDGIMAPAGIALEAKLVELGGKVTAPLIQSYTPRLYQQILVRASTRVASSGTAGGASAAIDAGLRSATVGNDLETISADMRSAGITGLALGGAVGGVVEVPQLLLLRQLRTRLPDMIQQVRSTAHVDHITDTVLQSLQEVGHPDANRLAHLLNAAQDALDDTTIWVEVARDVISEQHFPIGTLLQGRNATMRVTQDVVVDLAERQGRAPQRWLVRTETPAGFDQKVLTTGSSFVDANFAGGEHGAFTHLLQELVVDRALRAQGSSIAELRELLASERLPTQLRTELWDAFFDRPGPGAFGSNPDRVQRAVGTFLGLP